MNEKLTLNEAKSKNNKILGIIALNLALILSSCGNGNKEGQIIYDGTKYPRTETYEIKIKDSNGNTIETLPIKIEGNRSSSFGNIYQYYIKHQKLSGHVNGNCRLARDIDGMTDDLIFQINETFKDRGIENRNEQMCEITNKINLIKKDMKYRIGETNKTNTETYTGAKNDSAYKTHNYQEILNFKDLD